MGVKVRSRGGETLDYRGPRVVIRLAEDARVQLLLHTGATVQANLQGGGGGGGGRGERGVPATQLSWCLLTISSQVLVCILQFGFVHVCMRR